MLVVESIAVLSFGNVIDDLRCGTITGLVRGMHKGGSFSVRLSREIYIDTTRLGDLLGKYQRQT